MGKENRNFIPELHDIGKLIDKNVIEKLGLRSSKGVRKHTFAKFDFDYHGFVRPESVSFLTQYHHMHYKKKENIWVDDYTSNSITKIDINNWEFCSAEYRRNLFLLILADHMASSISRSLYGFYKIWRPKGTEKHDRIVTLWKRDYHGSEQTSADQQAAFLNEEDLKKLFDELENCKDGRQFLEHYESYLKLTPEDKSFPRNITSLYTHVKLVGQMYRVLEKCTSVIHEEDGSLAIEYEGKAVKTIKEARGTKGDKDDNTNGWKARFIKCTIKFTNSFARLRDINIIALRDEGIEKIKEKYKDEVLFSTSDYIVLFLPLNQKTHSVELDLERIFEPLLEYGFYIEAIETVAELGKLDSIRDRKVLEVRKEACKIENKNTKQRNRQFDENVGVKVYFKHILPETTQEIAPPICDICQQRNGKERVKENIKEWLCDKCLNIRENAGRFRDYGEEWDREGVKVCWFKFSLVPENLEDWLVQAFRKYISNKESGFVNSLVKSFRPLALQVNFNEDYRAMLKEFRDKFSKREEFLTPIAGYDELGVFKYTPEIMKEVIESFMELTKSFFPDCECGKTSPFNLSLSIANIKYPVRDHWKYFEKQGKSLLNIRCHNVFETQYTKYEINAIMQKIITPHVSQSFLHNLINLDERFKSDSMLIVEIFNSRNRDGCYEPFELMKEGIAPSKFLNLYRVLKGGKNGSE